MGGVDPDPRPRRPEPVRRPRWTSAPAHAAGDPRLLDRLPRRAHPAAAAARGSSSSPRSGCCRQPSSGPSARRRRRRTWWFWSRSPTTCFAVPRTRRSACWGCTREPVPGPGRRCAPGHDDPRADPVRLARPCEPPARAARSRPRWTTPRAAPTSWRVSARSCTGRSTAAGARCRRAGASRSRSPPDPWLGAALSDANTGRGSWEAGWTVVRIDGSEAVVCVFARARASSDDRLPPADRPRSGRGGQRPRAEGASVAVTRLLHGGQRCAGGGGFARRRPARLLARDQDRRSGADARAHVAAQRGRGAVPAEGRRPSVPPRPLRRRRPVPAGRELSSRVRRDAARRSRQRWRRTCGRRSRRSRSRSLRASASPRTTAAPRASAPAAAGCSPRRSCALTPTVSRRPGARLDVVAERFAADGVEIDAPYREPSFSGRHVL